MSTSALAATQPSLIKRMAERYGVEEAKLYNMIVSTIFPSKVGEKDFKPSAEQVMAFLIIAEQYDLNPILREIYPFIDKSGNLRVIVGIDGWIKAVQRQPDFDGHEFIPHYDTDKRVFAITCRIFRRGRSHPIEMTEYMSECRRETEPWKQWPIRMLHHKAFIQTSRYAFGMSGVEDEDDFDRSNVIEVGRGPVEAPRRLSESAKPAALPAAATAPAETEQPKPETNGPKAETKAAEADPVLTEAETKEVWHIGMNRGLARVDINKMISEKFGVATVRDLRKSQMQAAIDHLIEGKKP